MREILGTVNLKEFLKASVFPIFAILYILYPLWMLSEDPLIVMIFGYGIILMPFLIRYLIDSIWPESSKELDIGLFIRSRKLDLVYFLVTAIVYWMWLSPLIFAPLSPRGDEPTHVSRIIVLSLMWTFDGLVSTVIVGVVLILGLAITVLFILAWSVPKRESFFLWPLLRIFFKTKIRYLLYVALAILPIFMGFFSTRYNVGTYSLTRYGPFHPVVFVLPFLLLGYSTSLIVIWKTLNLFIMVGAAAIIRRFTAEILSRIDNRLTLETRTNRVLSMLSGWIFLILAPVIEFSVVVYLTSGVALFFAVNCLLLLRTLTASGEKQQRFYLVSLVLFLGFSSLWKRVLLVQAGAAFLILFVFLVVRGASDRKQSTITLIKSGLIYGCIFGPWFIIVQLQGYIWREFVPEPSYLFSHQLFDYLLRFDTQVGVILGIASYTTLVVLFLLGISLRKKSLTVLAPQFALWYLFFTLDAGWPHTVDRFFVPALSLLIVSLMTTIGILIVHSQPIVQRLTMRFAAKKSPSESLQVLPSKKTMLSFLLLISLLGTTIAGATQNVLAGNSYVGTALDTKYIPYDQAAQYIVQQIDGNLSLVYSVWGPSSFIYYLNIYGSYPYVGDSLGEVWTPDPNNVTTEAFIEFLESSGYTVLALPSAHLVDSRLIPTDIVESLISNYSSYGISHLEVFSYGSNEFYVWLL